MQDWQQRVIDEKKALDEKRSKLSAFLSSPEIEKVSKAEWDRLLRQEDAMTIYSGILGDRIQEFTD